MSENGVPGEATGAEINDHLQAIADILWRSNTDTGEPVAVSWALAPLSDDTNPKSEEGQIR